MVYGTYSHLRNYRNTFLKDHSLHHFELNHFHDELIQAVINEAIHHVKKERGPFPSPFSFFMMGSAGRFEQAIWSDQDHGIVYEKDSQMAHQYFSALAVEITEGLYQVGYEECDGGVMATNRLWSKSVQQWHNQLHDWISEGSWESIRHLLIFIDARSMYGNDQFVYELKEAVYQSIKKYNLTKRMLENTLRIKKGVGLFGQFLTEMHGTHTGQLNIKETAFLPYVNSIRLLAIKENIFETSTLSRLKRLPHHIMPSCAIQHYESQFLKLLTCRLIHGDHFDYETGHYLSINRLSKRQKKDVKGILKSGLELYQYTRKMIEKGGALCK